MTHDFPPRLMPAPVAARYIGVSETTLRGLNLPRKELRSKRLYDKADLDAYASTSEVYTKGVERRRLAESAISKLAGLDW